MKRAYIDTPEGQVHYRTEGKGKPMLLLHRVGMSSDEFTETIPFLSQHRQVVAMDLLGYGSSDLPAPESRIEDYARNVVHVLDALGIERTDLLGSRLGASVAVEVAAAHAPRVNRLILLGCIFPPPEEQQEHVDSSRQKRMQIKEDGSHLADLWQYHAPFTYTSLEMRQRDVVDHLRSGLGTRSEDGHIALFSYDMASRLPAIKSPTLLLSTSGDHWQRRIEAARSLIARCQARTIDIKGHVPTWDRPLEMAQAILEFLETPEGRL